MDPHGPRMFQMFPLMSGVNGQTSLDKVVVFMWLFKVVMKFRTFEEDHPELIKERIPVGSPNVSTGESTGCPGCPYQNSYF